MTLRILGLWGPVVLYMAGIFTASSMTSPPVPGGADKPWHVLAYVGLAVLLVRGLAGGLPRRIGARTALVAVVVAAIYGMSDELHQMFVPGRTAALDDLFADSIGALIGAGACWAWGIIASAPRDEL